MYIYIYIYIYSALIQHTHSTSDQNKFSQAHISVVVATRGNHSLFLTVVTQKHSPILLKHYTERQRTKIHIEVTLIIVIQTPFVFSTDDDDKPAEMYVVFMPSTDVVQPLGGTRLARRCYASVGHILKSCTYYKNHTII